MRYSLADLLDIPRLQAFLDSLYDIYSIPSAIIDTEGNILTATAWQDICVRFHRSNPETEKRCIESNTRIAAGLSRGETQVIYKCPQGMVDIATPIVVDGKHIGNAFTGQLFLEPPDEDFFRKQARRYGFNEEGYIAALRKVPVVPDEKLKRNLRVLSGLAAMLAEQGLQHKRQLELEAETRQRETRYRTLFEQSPHAVLIMDPETSLPVEFNGNFASLLGYAPEELKKMKPSDFEAAEDPEEIRRHMDKILQEGGDEFETRHRCKDGSIKDVHVSARVIELDGKKYLHNILQDVTERNKTAEALRQSREMFRTLVEFTDSIHWEFDVALNRFTYVSPQVEKILGFSPDRWDTLESWADCLHPDDREWAILYCQNKTASREDHEFVYRAMAADGRVVWLRDIVKVIDDGENPVKLIGVMFDITSQKKSEQELSSSERKYRNLFTSIRDVIIVADSERNIIDANQPALREQFGYETDDILWRQTGVLHASDADFEQTGREVFDESKEPVVKLPEVAFRKKDGTTFPAELFVYKLLNDAGDIEGNIGVIRDITERKTAEMRVMASLREKELLLREVHHRVKNNMAVISSLLALQSEYLNDEKYLETFRECQGRIRSMALVHEKLYQKEDFVSIDIKDYITSLGESINVTFAGDSSIQFVTDIEPLQLDIDTLVPCGLIINELLTNSYKHAFAGVDGRQIALSLTYTGDKDISLTISDNGRGLPGGFDISRDSGLGLKLVHTLVNQLNGEMEMRGESGTTFIITFPRHVEIARPS